MRLFLSLLVSSAVFAEEKGPTMKEMKCALNSRFEKLEERIESLAESKEGTCSEKRTRPPKKSLEHFEEIGHLMAGNIDWNVDPCEDFYQHACGAGTRDTFVSDIAEEEIYRRMEFTNANPDLPEDEITPPIENALNYFKRFQELKEGRQDNVDSLNAEMAEIVERLGGSPWLDNADYSAVNPFRTLLISRKVYSTSADIITVGPDENNAEKNAFFLGLMELARNDFTKALRGTIGFRKVMGITEPALNESEISLQISLLDSVIYDLFDYEEWQAKYADLEAFLPLLIDALTEEMPFFFMNELREMNIYTSVKDLEKFNAFVASNRTLLQGLAVGLVLSKYYDEDGWKFNVNNNTISSAWAMGFSETMSGKAEPLFHRLYAHHFGPNQHDIDALLEIRRSIEMIRQELVKRVFELDWIDTLSKARVIDKLNLIIPRVAFSPWILDKDKLSSYYSYLPALSGTESFIKIAAGFAANRWAQKTVEMTAKRTPLGETFAADTFEINAYYHTIENTITILQGILTPPIYHPRYPIEYIFGSLGLVLGHEITHSIDPNSISTFIGSSATFLYEKARENMVQLTRCFSTQYANICFDVVGENETCTDILYDYDCPEVNSSICIGDSAEQMLGEIVADDGGLRTAFSALKTLKDSGFQVHEVPGLENRTSDQIFFYSYAAFWCMDPEILKDKDRMEGRIRYGSHPPGPARVNGNLRNFPEFARAFRCPIKAKMTQNVKERCTVW